MFSAEQIVHNPLMHIDPELMHCTQFVSYWHSSVARGQLTLPPQQPQLSASELRSTQVSPQRSGVGDAHARTTYQRLSQDNAQDMNVLLQVVVTDVVMYTEVVVGVRIVVLSVPTVLVVNTLVDAVKTADDSVAAVAVVVGADIERQSHAVEMREHGNTAGGPGQVPTVDVVCDDAGKTDLLLVAEGVLELVEEVSLVLVEEICLELVGEVCLELVEGTCLELVEEVFLELVVDICLELVEDVCLELVEERCVELVDKVVFDLGFPVELVLVVSTCRAHIEGPDKRNGLLSTLSYSGLRHAW
jgi:hypothetical protein